MSPIRQKKTYSQAIDNWLIRTVERIRRKTGGRMIVKGYSILVGIIKRN